jgi:hypothetical protein
MDINSKILLAIKKHPSLMDTPQLHGMFSRWIGGGLISNTGAFLVHKISRIHFACSENWKTARFSCDLTVTTPPAYNAERKARYTWNLTKDGRYHGEVKSA